MVKKKPRRIMTDEEMHQSYMEQAPIRQRAMFGDKPKGKGFTDTPPKEVSFLSPDSLKIISNYMRTLDKKDRSLSNAKIRQLVETIKIFAENNNKFPYDNFDNIFTEEVIDGVINVEILNMGDILYEVGQLLQKSKISSKKGVITAEIYPRKDANLRRIFRVNALDTKITPREVSLTEEDLLSETILVRAYTQMVKTFGLNFNRKDSLRESFMKTIYNRMMKISPKDRDIITGPEFVNKFVVVINQIKGILEEGYESNTFDGIIGEIARNNRDFFRNNIKTLAYFLMYNKYDVSEENNTIIREVLDEVYDLGDEEDEVKTLREIIIRIYLLDRKGKLSILKEKANDVARDLEDGRLLLSMEFLKADISSLDEDRRREIKTILQNSHPTEYFGEDYLKLGKLINILGDVADTDEETLLEELGVENLQMVKKAAALRKIYERLYRTLRDIVYEEE